MKGNVLLVGGRSKAKSLAQSLLNKGYRVTVINKDLPDCEKLAENEKLTVIHGDGTKPYVLEDAGAGNMELAIALTPRDEDNLVICELCKKKFGASKTLSLLSPTMTTPIFSLLSWQRNFTAWGGSSPGCMTRSGTASTGSWASTPSARQCCPLTKSTSYWKRRREYERKCAFGRWS